MPAPLPDNAAQNDPGHIADHNLIVAAVSELQPLLTTVTEKMRWQGAWSSASTYVTNDVVTRGGRAFVATAAHTANDFDPAGSTSVVGTGGLNQDPSNQVIGQDLHSSTQFTVNAQTTITRVSMIAGDNGIPAGVTIGIASDWSGSSTVPWLGKGDTTVSAGNGVTTTVTLDTPVLLSTGTTYRVVIDSSLSGSFRMGFDGFTGIVASTGTTNTGATYSGGLAGRRQYFTLSATTPGTNWAAMGDDVVGALAAHAAASNPHPGYLTQTEGDARYSLPVTVQDENGNVATGVTQIDFQGAGVTAAAGTGEVVVTIPGGGGGGGGSSTPTGARAYRSAALALANATVTQIPLDAESWDTGTLHDNTTNPSRITVPTAGKYLIVGQIAHQAGSGQVQTRVHKNGVALGIAIDQGEAGQPTVTYTDVCDLAANDYLELYAYQASGAASAINPGEYSTFLMATLLSGAGVGDGTAPAWVTFTPTVTQGVAVSIVANTMQYLILGPVALVRGYIQATSNGTAGAAVEITLPSILTASVAAAYYQQVGAGIWADEGVGYYDVNWYLSATDKLRAKVYNQYQDVGVAPSAALLAADSDRMSISGVIPLATPGAWPGGGSSLSAPVTKTAAYTAVANDFVLANAAGGGFTITLPAAPASGSQVAVKKIDTTANLVTVVGSGSTTIDGDASAYLTTEGVSVTFVYDGTNWRVLSTARDAGGGLPGQLLDVKQVNPTNSAAVYSLAAAGSFGPVDTAQLALSFVVPPSGRVLLRVSGQLGNSSVSFNYLAWSTPAVPNAVLQGLYLYRRITTAGTDGISRVVGEHLATGLTPGAAQTIYLAWSPPSAGTSSLYAGQDGYGPLTISVTAA